MLSKTEQEFLNNPLIFKPNYQRSLRRRLKVKAEKMRRNFLCSSPRVLLKTAAALLNSAATGKAKIAPFQ
jgi:hypothetical protein